MGSNTTISRLKNVNPSTLCHFPSTLINQLGVPTPSVEFMQTGQAHVTLSEWPENDHNIERNAASHEGNLNFPQIFTDLGLLIFQLSNRLSTGNSYDDKKQLSDLSDTLKTIALSSSSWKNLLIASRGPSSMSLIEKLFNFSITEGDVTLTDMMLRIGADPNQQVWDNRSQKFVSALEFSIRSRSIGIINLLLNSGAAYGQRTLAHAVVAGDFDTADRLLRSDPCLDLDFNYLDDLESYVTLSLQPLELETVTTLGLVCLEHLGHRCFCQVGENTVFAFTGGHQIGCRVGGCVDSLGFLLEHRATMTLDTMILASFTVDITALQFLIQNGGNVCGLNKFGFSCLSAAILRVKLQYDVFSQLLFSGATMDIPATHHAFGFQASPLHRLLLRDRPYHKIKNDPLRKIFYLLINSGADINYRILHLSPPSRMVEAHERLFWWSSSSQYATSMECVAHGQAESPLEYAIIAGYEDFALEMVSRGCHLTGREITLAVRFGLLCLTKELVKLGWWDSNGEKVRRACMRLALRWCHEPIVRFLLKDEVRFCRQDMIDALQYEGVLYLSTQTQIELIRATPDLEWQPASGLMLLELCFRKFSGVAAREILRRFPTVYSSEALSTIVLRILKYDLLGEDAFHIADIQNLISRRTERNCDWADENAAVLAAVVSKRPDILRILADPRANCAMKTVRLPKKDFSWLLNPECRSAPYRWMDPAHRVGCQDWVTCSPITGIAMTADWSLDWPIAEDMLRHLLACSYEPDALTVVVATTRANLRLLRQLRGLQNWRAIASIDSHGRPPWCPTALQIAASEENEGLVDFFLGAGVSVNEKPAIQPFRNHMPRTVLQAAIGTQNSRLTDLFIERGADINAPAAEDSGATALQLACIHGNVDLSIRLLELGADPNAKGALRRGRTAMEGAAEHGRIDTIQLLLNYGVGTDGPHREQYIKAIVHAERNQNFAAAALLKEHRAWTDEDEECYKSLQLYEWCDV